VNPTLVRNWYLALERSDSGDASQWEYIDIEEDLDEDLGDLFLGIEDQILERGILSEYITEDMFPSLAMIKFSDEGVEQVRAGIRVDFDDDEDGSGADEVEWEELGEIVQDFLEQKGFYELAEEKELYGSNDEGDPEDLSEFEIVAIYNDKLVFDL